MRTKCRSRSAIEPVIGHIKNDHRMLRNYLKGSIGDEINAILAGAAFNFKRLLRIYEQELIFVLFRNLLIKLNFPDLLLKWSY